MARNFFLPGQIVIVKKAGVFEHEGVVVHGNHVIHNSPQRGGVVLTTMDDFAGGEMPTLSEQYSPRVSLDQMIMRAYDAVGKKKWLPWYNCQHFISEIAGLRPQSRQMAQVLPILLMACLAISLSR